MITLAPVTKFDLELIRQERNKMPYALRSNLYTTREQQDNFYEQIRTDNSMVYYSLYQKGTFIGCCGLYNINDENRTAELSLILLELDRGKGKGTKALNCLLDYGFGQLNLNIVFGECFVCNPNIIFWEKKCLQFNAKTAILPARKYHNYKYHDSLYFSFAKEDYIAAIQRNFNN